MKQTLAALLGFIPLLRPMAATARQSDDFQHTVNGEGVTITGYTGIGGAVTIPGTINAAGRLRTMKHKLLFGLAGIGTGIGMIVWGMSLYGEGATSDFPFYLGILGISLVSGAVVFLFLTASYKDVAELLRRHGGHGESTRQSATSNPPPPSTRTIPGSSSSGFHHAALDGDLETVKALLDTGADVNARDNGGQTPLHWAASGGRKDVVEFSGVGPLEANRPGAVKSGQ